MEVSHEKWFTPIFHQSVLKAMKKSQGESSKQAALENSLRRWDSGWWHDGVIVWFALMSALQDWDLHEFPHLARKSWNNHHPVTRLHKISPSWRWICHFLVQECLCHPIEWLGQDQAGIWDGSILSFPVSNSSSRKAALPKCIFTSVDEIPALSSCWFLQAALAPCSPSRSESSGQKADFWVLSDATLAWKLEIKEEQEVAYNRLINPAKKPPGQSLMTFTSG